MEQVAVVRRNQIQLIASAISAQGIEPERVVDRAGIPMWINGDPDGFIPRADMLRFMNTAARLSGDAYFGVSVGETIPLGRLSSLIEVVMTSKTLGDALNRLCQVIPYHSSKSRIWLTYDLDTVWCHHNYRQHQSEPMGQHCQYIARHLVRVVELAAGPGWRPEALLMPVSRRQRLEHSETFAGAHVQYDAESIAIAIPRAHLDLQMPKCDNLTLDDPERFMSETAPARDLPGHIKQIVTAMLETGDVSIEFAAEILQTSGRTLQRGLQECGSSYRRIVDEVRFAKADELLTASDMPLSDVGARLGYSHGTHFFRAFRRWSGMTPSEYRRHRRPDDH